MGMGTPLGRRRASCFLQPAQKRRRPRRVQPPSAQLCLHLHRCVCTLLDYARCVCSACSAPKARQRGLAWPSVIRTTVLGVETVVTVIPVTDSQGIHHSLATGARRPGPGQTRQAHAETATRMPNAASGKPRQDQLSPANCEAATHEPAPAAEQPTMIALFQASKGPLDDGRPLLRFQCPSAPLGRAHARTASREGEIFTARVVKKSWLQPPARHRANGSPDTGHGHGD